MDFIYNLSSFMALIVIVVTIVGLIKPKLLRNKVIPRKYISRRYIASAGIGLFVVLGIIVGVTEPESVRLAREQQEQASQQAKLAAETQSVVAESKVETKAISPKQTTTERDYWHKVVRVVDGDTVRAMVDGKEESIRIIGIDTPESKTSNECFGTEASNKAKELLENKWIQIEKDPTQDTRDKYGRLLRYVYVGNTTDFGNTMLTEGYAFEYTYNIPYQKQKQYKASESAAKSGSKGLWATSACSGQRIKPSVTSAPAAAPKPQPTAQPAPPSDSNCDPNYTPCIPNVSYDLDCGDIGHSVQIIGTDRHRLDGRDNDGYGCESY